MFALDYFGQNSYLIQTGQLYLEALIPTLGNVYCIGPSFRAEPDVDNRHVTEFTLIELELACNFEELLVHIENLVYDMIHRAAQKRKHELELLDVDRSRLLSVRMPFARVSYTDAIEILQSMDINVKWGDDLKSMHEKKITEHFGNRPTFITHYPEAIKFFNMKRNSENKKIVNSADLIVPYSGECVGAAEREHEHDILTEKLKKSNMLRMLEKRGGSIEDFRWYLDHVKSGVDPHSGCGIGLNRVVQFVLGTDDIRACTAYPLNRETLL
jgi:asparaginyl-tRNA synthetase